MERAIVKMLTFVCGVSSATLLITLVIMIIRDARIF
ncbi:hypothetical protein BNKMLPFJ_00058 [Escherichia phage vB_EcoS-26175IV]|uniref:Uncharacterized protein n=1 Tax=Escherichia phage vB_EcoS-26175I TaxID=2576478 RepID=A0A5P1M7W0_9CAUD|nr:hypothetical protein HEDJPLGI_00037 [Escherichia phage vB_EcoS-26175I]QDK00085.1 hypothetical protein EGCEDKNN_00005 [Escherichia phage vB_EcoS-26175II]QDK00394.1 hypothetical protein INCEGHDL_00187 [Escherichia phage vB_EcoS-26175III]QDK00454.1 hypothetical protein BNKMLPFJ_00058 [Escherichia phage vB_EcoS-26175IV]QDK00691.1 hypothetical protein JOHFDMOO_00168 [Escherichia phage vB_EcoS-26175V]